VKWPWVAEAVAVQVLAISPSFATDKLVFRWDRGRTACCALRMAAHASPRCPISPDHGISALVISQDGRTVIVAAGDELLRSKTAA